MTRRTQIPSSRTLRWPLWAFGLLLLGTGCPPSLNGGDDDDAADDDDATDDDDDALITTTIDVVGVTLGDAGGDAVWSPGESLSLTLAVQNSGPIDHMYYPEVVLETDAPEVTPARSVSPFFGVAVGDPVEAWFQLEAGEELTGTTTVSFTAWVRPMVEGCGDELNPCIDSEPFTFTAAIE